MRAIHSHSVALLLAVAAAATPSPAQDKADSQSPTVPQLIEQLGDRRYAVRKSAEEALRQRGAAISDQLEKAADTTQDAEIAWRLRRLLKQIEGGPGATPNRLQPRSGDRPQPRFAPFRWGPQTDLEGRFDQIFEQMEREFGLQIRRSNFFDNDFFKDLQDQMQGLQRGMAMGLPGTGQAFSMSIGPDGVRVQITEKNASGEEETKTYEAPDVASFREKYPEIADRYLQDGGGGLHFGWQTTPAPMAVPPQVLRRWAQPDVFQTPDAAVLDSGERLGVYVDEVAPAVREFLDLDDGVGLAVTSVVEGSLAAELGIADGDVLLEVAGKSIQSTDDVRAALGGVEPGSKVEVKVNRRGTVETLSAKKPERKESAKKLEKRTVR